jgi:hypothetical protein
MFNKLIVSMFLAMAATLAFAKADLPAASHDGLHLMPDTKLRAVYMKPGADLSQYDKVALLDAYVAFRKHWQREHNEDEPFENNYNGEYGPNNGDQNVLNIKPVMRWRSVKTGT